MYCHMLRVTIDGVGFIAHLKLITIINYSTIADSHTSQFTAVCTKSSQSAMTSTSRCLATCLSNVCFRAYVVASWLHTLCPCSCKLHSLTNIAVHYSTDYSSESSLALLGSSFQRWPFLCPELSSPTAVSWLTVVELNSPRWLGCPNPESELLHDWRVFFFFFQLPLGS
jgi:hypothetical protein